MTAREPVSYRHRVERRAPEEPGTAARAEPNPLVSCIIIFLNEEKYLAEAIESVLAQSYANWELLLVDDGSTDCSEPIARSYCDHFAGKIRYLTHEKRANRGMSASRNLGLNFARGDFVAFLDGDDCWYPDKLERQVTLFEENPAAVMVCGATLYWHSWDPISGLGDEVRHVGQGATGKGLALDRLYSRGELIRRLYPLGKGLTPSSSGNMMRRDAVLLAGGYEEAFRGMFEDQVFRAKMYVHGPIYVSSDIFDRYRQHAESCYQVSRRSKASEGAREQFFRWLQNYLDEVGYHGPFVRLKLWRKMLRYKHPLIHSTASRVFQRAGKR